MKTVITEYGSICISAAGTMMILALVLQIFEGSGGIIPLLILHWGMGI